MGLLVLLSIPSLLATAFLIGTITGQTVYPRLRGQR